MQAIHATLKQRHRATREGMPQALNLRIHRALSWLQRAAQCDDPDACFIFLWIAFNAAYAQEIPQHLRLSEQDSFTAFLRKLHGLDSHQKLDDLVWNTFSGPIRVLLDNPYVFESFWSFQRGDIDEVTWCGFQSYLVTRSSVRGQEFKIRWTPHRLTWTAANDPLLSFVCSIKCLLCSDCCRSCLQVYVRFLPCSSRLVKVMKQIHEAGSHLENSRRFNLHI